MPTKAARADTGDPYPLEQLHETFRMHPEAGDEARWQKLSRACIGLDVMPGYDSSFAGDIARGLRTNAYAAFVWQAASDALPDERSTIGAGRLNLRVDALLFRHEGEGMGRVTAQVHVNGVWPDLSDSMQASTGAITDLDELASRHPSTLSRLAYTQTFFDDRLMLSIGKIGPNDFVMSNLFANNEASQFLAQAFDGNSVWPVCFQNHTVGAGIVSLPADWCFLNGFLVDAAGTESPWLGDAFGDGFAVSAEAGLIGELEGLPVRLSFAWCGTDATADTVSDRDSGDGLWGNAYGSIAQILIQPKFALWAQWSASNRSVASDAASEVAIGTTIDDCFGRAGDGFGAAIAWSTPTDETLDDQILLECYYRLQVAKGVQISLDGQVLMPSATAALNDPTVIGSVRAMWEF
ncbi:MAG: carbohydrate porin [Planctomycetota bacterium]